MILPVRVVALVLTVLTLTACHRGRVTGAGRSGDAGDTAALASQPEARRIVSIVPSATEVLFALGAGDRVVGRSDFDDYPPSITHVPSVGGMVNPSFEAIVALHPDALVGVQGPINRAVVDRVHGMGVRTLFPRVESLAEVQSSIDLFAALVHRPDAAAALHARIASGIEHVRSAVAGKGRPKVLAVFSQHPLVVAGAGSWFDEILSIAGGQNVVATAGNHYPMVSMEQVLAWAPDYVIDLTWHNDPAPLADALASYPALPAVRDHHVVRFTDVVMIRQGPRIADAAVLVGRALHPDAGL